MALGPSVPTTSYVVVYNPSQVNNNKQKKKDTSYKFSNY